MSFGSRMSAARSAYGPLCVGIDPHPEILELWGLDDSVDGLTQFTRICVDAFAGHVGFIKPQAAFFERFASPGVAVLEDLLAASRHTGSLVILDAKRGDIGSTAHAYADAYLNEDSPLAVDAITVNPFLGVQALDPFFEAAAVSDAGVFVLALTSNPEGAQVQHAHADDRTVAGAILDHLRTRNGGASPMGSAGAVVGATIGSTEENLDINGPLLVPGLGAQGAGPEDIHRLFADVPHAVIPSVSRAVLRAGPRVADLRACVARMADALVSS